LVRHFHVLRFTHPHSKLTKSMTSLNMARQLLCIYFWLRVLRCSLKRNWRLEFEARVAMTTTHRQTWLFSSTSTYHSPDLVTARGVAHLVVHGTTGSTSYETIPPVRLESSRGVLSTVDMVVQRRDGPRRLRDHDDNDDWKWPAQGTSTVPIVSAHFRSLFRGLIRL